MVIAIFFLNCTNDKSPIESEPEQPRIILGESIEGVSIGDDSLSVITKLGQPTNIAIGDFAGYILIFSEGKHALTQVVISTDPALGLGVTSVSVKPPYQGITEDSIGLGSEHSFVISKIGEPNRVFGDNSSSDAYYYEKNDFIFYYDNERVHAIGMVTPFRE